MSVKFFKLNCEFTLALLYSISSNLTIDFAELHRSTCCIVSACINIFTTVLGQLDDIMTRALKENKVKFVRLLLLNGVVMKEYLTVSHLRELYDAVRYSFLLFQLFLGLGGLKK